MKIAVLSPHRDDAAFSASLAIDFWLGQGHSVTIVNCFTRSDYAPFSDAQSLHPNDRLSYVTALRLREDERWSRSFGAGLKLIDLNLKDAPLRLRCGIDDVCTAPIKVEDKALSKIHNALTRLSPDAFLLPLALGAHVDHRTVLESVRPLLIAGLAYACYEDLPYAARPGAAAVIAETAHAITPLLRPTFTEAARDTQAAMVRKRKLALAYDSQVDDITTDQIAAFSTRYKGRERLWANPAWCASPLWFEDAQA